MKAATFNKIFQERFDRKVEGINLLIMPVLRVNTLILETLLEVAEFHSLHIDAISLEHKPMGKYMLTVNNDQSIVLHIEKRKEAVHA